MPALAEEHGAVARCSVMSVTTERPRPAKAAGAERALESSTRDLGSSLALGLKPKELGLQRHVVKPTSVIDWTNAVVAGAPS